MASSMSAYGFEENLNDSSTQAETPSMDAATPVSSCPSSPASSPSTQSDKSYIPRPPNAFLIFRSDFLALNKKKLLRNQQQTSISAGRAWKKLPEEEKDHYKERADQKKREHALAHPGYRYNPRRSRRGKKFNRRKKIKAPVVSVSTDEQSIYYPSPNTVAAVHEVLLPLDPIYSSVDLSHRHSMTTPNEISLVLDMNHWQGTDMMQGFRHLPPPAASPFNWSGFPQLNTFSSDTTLTVNENDGFDDFLMTPDLDPSFPSLTGMYPGSAWEFASSALLLRDTTTYSSVGYSVYANPEDYPGPFYVLER